MMGETVSHYRILEKLGEGGMGVVYKAHDTDLDRDVALKFLPPHITTNETEQVRFLQEARAAALLNHPNICTVYAIEKSGDKHFIIMEFVDGWTLRQLEPWKLKRESILTYAIQIAEGLQEAHSKGIVHRDIKLDNIMVNSKNQIKLMDFGLAKLKGSLKLTKTSSTVGTLAYMAPEQIQGGEVDARSDIFSFGVVLYEMLTGHIPFRGEHDAAMMYSILNENPDPLDKYSLNASPALQQILGRSLEKDPGNRYQSATEILRELRVLQKEPFQIKDAHLRELPLRRKRVLALTFAATIASLVLATAIFNSSDTAAPARRSIAVLPFENLSTEEDAFFSDGITEDIITQLSKIRELRVISRLSVVKYRNDNPGIKEIGRELEVSAILQGSVRRSGNQLRITARLIDVASEEHLWAEMFDRERAEVFAIQGEIAVKIAAALKTELAPSEQQSIEKKQTANIDAYALYLKGREYYYAYQKERNEDAIRYFKSALQIDPRYALAYSGLGDAYAKGVELFGLDRAWIDSSIDASTFALALDPYLAEAHKSLGNAYSRKGWVRRALGSHLRSVDLNPNYYPAVYSVGYDYLDLGRLDSARYWMKKGMELAPGYPLGYLAAANVEGLLSNDARAEQLSRRALELDRNLIGAHFHLALLYLSQGRDADAEAEAIREMINNPASHALGTILLFLERNDEARPQFEEATRSSKADPEPPMILGFIYSTMDRKGKAAALLSRSVRGLHELRTRGNTQSWVAYDLARIYSVQGNKNEAYRFLQEAVDNGWINHRFSRGDPLLKDIRNDERFRQLMDEVRKRVEAMRIRSENIAL